MAPFTGRQPLLSLRRSAQTSTVLFAAQPRNPSLFAQSARRPFPQQTLRVPHRHYAKRPNAAAAARAAAQARSSRRPPSPAFAAADASSEASRPPFPFFWALSAAAFAASLGYLYVQFTRDSDDGGGTAAGVGASTSAVPADVSDRYHQTAATFDSEVGAWEAGIGLNRLRRRLVRKARGHVLEVSAGTGRNTEYYDLGGGSNAVESLTLLDQAAEMTAVSRDKYLALRRGRGRVRFLTQSALDDVPGAPPEGFDTVVETMGLCSTGDPVALLRHLGGLVRRDGDDGEGGGRILLLEHGRGHYDWLNRKLDASAAAHADRHGCWWNRDIGRIVEESGLEVVAIKRHHLGTTWWVELRPALEKHTPVTGTSSG